MNSIQLPSQDGHGENALYANIPGNMSVKDAVRFANQVIYEANKEDHESEAGVCLDGESVESNVRRRLTEAGFVFFDLACTLEWDAYSEVPPDVIK
jgi:hypothetical protein